MPFIILRIAGILFLLFSTIWLEFSLFFLNFFSSFCLHFAFLIKPYRIRIETVLLKSNVLVEVQRSVVEGGMHVEDLPVDPASRSGTVSHLGQPRIPTGPPERFKEVFHGIGGPAGLWHFIYRSIYLDQYVASEFSSPISSLQQQKR